jgi:hypothetical protein
MSLDFGRRHEIEAASLFMARTAFYPIKPFLDVLHNIPILINLHNPLKRRAPLVKELS